MTAQLHTADGRMLTADDVAEYLAVSRSAVYALMDSRRLGSVRVGRYRRVTPEQLRRFVEDNATDPTPATDASPEPQPGTTEKPAPATGSGVTFIGDGLTGRSRSAGGWS